MHQHRQPGEDLGDGVRGTSLDPDTEVISSMTSGRARIPGEYEPLLAAYGPTARERDVCHVVPAGLSTSDIAARLAVSAHTVQDHLKSVFAKVGVRSRGELTAALLS